MADIAKQLGLDHTFFYIFGTFAVFYVIISQIYLKPFQKFLLRRREALGQVKSAQDLFKALDEKMSQIETELQKVRFEAAKKYEDATREAQAREEAQLSALRDELKKEYLTLNTKLEAEKKQIEADLESSVDQLAIDLSQKILAGK